MVAVVVVHFFGLDNLLIFAAIVGLDSPQR